MMNNLNSILLEGNLVRDPDLRCTPQGTPVCSLTVACNRYYKQNEELQEEVSYFDVTTWNRLAEVCNEYLTKGRGVRVVGRLKQDRWQDTDGKTRSKVHVVAEHVEFKPKLNGKPDGEGAGEAAQGEAAGDAAEGEAVGDRQPEELVAAAEDLGGEAS